VRKFVTNWSEVPYPIIVSGETLVRVFLQEMFFRDTALHICMYSYKHMYMYKERKKREREKATERQNIVLNG